ncbi:ABC transporter substrate-binding protein [Chloroflexi bacterium TSY]|nr:ABC transporter substrate-binding protein [Chloroflexi bacterium TSY]
MQRYRHLALLIVLGMMIAACAPGSQGVSEADAPAVQDEAAMEPQQGDTLILTTGDDFQGPAGDFDGGSTHDNRLMPLYLDTLMLGKQDGTLEPRLAESITLAEDGLTWTIKLHADALWHDGEPVVADDVIFVLNTMCSGLTNPPSRLNEYATIIGCQAYRDGEADSASGVTKVDEQTVQIVAEKPNAALLYQLAAMHPVPSHFWQDVELDKLLEHPRWLDNPIGSDPFKMTKFEGDQVIEYEAFEDYYLGRPYLDNVIVRIAPYDSALAALEAGEVDLVTYLDSLDAERLANNDSIIIDSTAETRTWGLFFHWYQEPLRDVRVRQALRMAVNRDAYNAAVLGGRGNAQVKSWYTPGTWPANPDIPADQYDPEAAEALLEEAGFDFENTTMGIVILPANKPRARIGEFFQANLAEIGVKAEVLPVQESVILEEWFNQRETIWFTIAYIGGTTSNNPYAWWQILRHDSPTNWGFYACNFVDESVLEGKSALETCGNYQYGSSELDALMDQALAIADPEQAAPIMWEIDKMLHEDPPGVMVVGPVTIHAWSSKLHGRPAGDVYDLQVWNKPEQWWLEQE